VMRKAERRSRRRSRSCRRCGTVLPAPARQPCSRSAICRRTPA
jgi:hypothetical protein